MQKKGTAQEFRMSHDPVREELEQVRELGQVRATWTDQTEDAETSRLSKMLSAA